MQNNQSQNLQKNTSTACAKLNKLNIAPRKVRLVVDLLRGKTLKQAHSILDFQTKRAALPLKKLITSAEANWKQNKANKQIEANQSNLYIQQIYVNSAGMLKRIKPAPQGRAHQIRKRMSHITLFISQQPNQPSTKKNK